MIRIMLWTFVSFVTLQSSSFEEITPSEGSGLNT